jgi:hypothetical protein
LRRHSRAKVMMQKTVLQKWCWNVVAKDNVAKAVLKQCCMMLQKQCWSNDAEDIIEMVLQKMLLQKITSAFVTSVHQAFFFFASFSLLFPCKEDDYKCCICFHLLLSLQDYGRKWRRMQHSLSSSAFLMKPR